MHKIFLFIFFSFLSTVVFGQNGNDPSDNFDGTYQFQMINTRGYPYIPSDINEIVRKNRKENETVYIPLGTMVILKILSLSEIKKEGFIPVEKIAYLSEKENVAR